MKKTLVALAALAVTGAFAQSSVTISGQLDAGLSSVTSTAGITATNVSSGYFGANRLRFVGVEDMGGGMKTNFLLEMQPGFNGSTSGNGLFNRGAWLGMSGGWGEFRLGRQGTTTIGVVCSIDQLGCYSGFAGGGILFSGNAGGATISNGVANWFAANPTRGGSGLALSTVAGGFSGLTPAAAGTTQVVAAAISTTQAADVTRVVNGITYLTPNWGGFTGQVQYAFGGTANATTSTTDGATSGLQLNYGNGPIWVGLAVMNAGGTAASPTTGSLTTVGGTYDFGMAKVGLGWQKETGSGAGVTFTDGTAWALTVVGKMGALSPYLKFGNRTESGGVRVGTETVAQIANLGVTYDMSKRTKLYADYGVDSQASNSRNGVGTSNPTTFGVGIQHTF